MTRWLLGVCLAIPVLLTGLSLQAGEVHEFNLDNGLQILVKEDHRTPVAVSQIWYKIGASYEYEGRTGVSHVLEHMMFKGTKKHPAGEFSRIMAANGAQENAFTGPDYTSYYQRLEKNRLEVSFRMEADRMRNLNLLEEEFQKERKVVMEERRMRTDDKPTALTYEHFKAAAFQTSPYRNPTIGWMNDLEQMSLADLKDWYKQWYAPNNAILVVAGDVNPQEVVALAKKHFGPLQASPPVHVRKRMETKQLGIRRINIKRPAKLPYLLMGYKVPSIASIAPENDWEVYALEVLAWVLDGDDSSRLSKNLVRGAEIATSASASYDLYSRLQDLFVFSGLPAKNYTLDDLESALRKEIEDLQDNLVKPEELERIKIQLMASKVYELDSVYSQAVRIGALAATGLDYRLPDRYMQRMNAVTPAQIREVARKYLTDGQLTVATLDPLPLGGTADTTESPADALVN